MSKDKKTDEDVATGYQPPEPKEDHERVGTEAWRRNRDGETLPEAEAEPEGEQ